MTAKIAHIEVPREITRRPTTRQRSGQVPETPISTFAALCTQHSHYYSLLAHLQGIPNSMPPTRTPQDRLTRAERCVFNDLVYLWVIALMNKTRKGMYTLVTHRNQAKRLKLSEPTIRRSLRKLEHLQLIKTTRRWNKKTNMEISLLITPGPLIYKRLFSFPQAKKNCGKVRDFPQK